MTEPTTSELMRIVQQMAEDSKEHRRELKETIGVLASDIRELKETTGEIKIQTTKTNGNVVQLRTDVYGGDGKDGLVKSYDGLKGRERYVAGSVDNVDVDFTNSLIIMDTGATEFDVPGVYSIWKDTILLTNNAQYDFAYSIVGGNTISGAKSIPFYTFQANGWKVRPDEADHTLNVVNGILVGESGADPFVNTLAPFTVRILFEQPVQAITVSTSGTVAPTAQQIRDAMALATAATPATGSIDSKIKQAINAALS